MGQTRSSFSAVKPGRFSNTVTYPCALGCTKIARLKMSLTYGTAKPLKSISDSFLSSRNSSSDNPIGDGSHRNCEVELVSSRTKPCEDSFMEECQVLHRPNHLCNEPWMVDPSAARTTTAALNHPWRHPICHYRRHLL